MTAPAPTARPVEPQTPLSGAEHRTVNRLLSWLGTVRQTERAHPQVTRWGVPALCAGLGLFQLNVPAGSGPGLPVALAVIAGLCVPLLWRKQRPMLVFAATSVASLAALPLGALTGADAARLVALFNVGRRGTSLQLAVAMAAAMAQSFVAVLVYSSDGEINHFTRGPALVLLALVEAAAMAGLGLASRLANAHVAALEEHAVRLEVERDQRARLAAAAERARIAREMHDILGHTLAVIVGLANGAAGLTEKSPRRGADTLRIIADTGHGALGELRRLLTVIHDDPGEPCDAPFAPQPGLADLDALLERVRAAGPGVTLHTEGDLTGLAPGLQLTVYRIVQEALTNTLKHAAGTPAIHVTVRADRELVHVTVEDTGPHRPARGSGPGDGKGLVGMRKRAALYQGSVTAGPNSCGGWAVRARLVPTPIPASSDLRENSPV
ncbi:histidine kinase [Streptomyces sp. NPDC048251]|uniref:sensor histidine kinase n=1 Tax=Streptomyces sp. NPDC048251 TaxID=3154501 RepID=UPI0034495DAF